MKGTCFFFFFKHVYIYIHIYIYVYTYIYIYIYIFLNRLFYFLRVPGSQIQDQLTRYHHEHRHPGPSRAKTAIPKSPFARGAGGGVAPCRPGHSSYANAKRRIMGVHNLRKFFATHQLPLSSQDSLISTIIFIHVCWVETTFQSKIRVFLFIFFVSNSFMPIYINHYQSRFVDYAMVYRTLLPAFRNYKHGHWRTHEPTLFTVWCRCFQVPSSHCAAPRVVRKLWKFAGDEAATTAKDKCFKPGKYGRNITHHILETLFLSKKDKKGKSRLVLPPDWGGLLGFSHHWWGWKPSWNESLAIMTSILSDHQR